MHAPAWSLFVLRRSIFGVRGVAPNSLFGHIRAVEEKVVAHAAPKRWLDVPDASGGDSDDVHVELGPGVRIRTPKQWAGRVPRPVVEVCDATFDPVMNAALRRSGIRFATAIQGVVWSFAHKRDVDIVGISTTGSGKTLAFAVPIVSWCKAQPPPLPKEPYAILLSPTRELAQQTYEQCQRVAAPCGVDVVLVHGGVNRKKRALQEQHLTKPVHVLVGTPGRVSELVRDQGLSVAALRYFVIDEADRLLELGLGDEVREIASGVSGAQRFFFSATWPRGVHAVVHEMTRPDQLVTVRITEDDTLPGPAKSILQEVKFVSIKKKKQSFLQWIRRVIQGQECRDFIRVLVFVSRREGADVLAREIERVTGRPCAAMHGDRMQPEREAALNAFRSGSTPVLVATDIASRGLDVKAIHYVVNYDLPDTTSQYVHRIGRTGRAGAAGTALTFFCHGATGQYGARDQRLAAGVVACMTSVGIDVPQELSDLAEQFYDSSTKTPRPSTSQKGAPLSAE